MRFQHYSMAGAVALVGCSIFALAGAVVFSTLGNSAQAGVGSAAPAVAAAAVAQGGGEPTIVWYGVSSANYDFNYGRWSLTTICRAWSDGRVETRWLRKRLSQDSADYFCNNNLECATGWITVNNPAQGLTYRSDINFDEQVDALDLGAVLADWGPAPRNDIPPSDCPLNLVNP